MELFLLAVVRLDRRSARLLQEEGFEEAQGFYSEVSLTMKSLTLKIIKNTEA